MCGSPDEALSVFYKARQMGRQLLSVDVWTAMIHTFGQNGMGREALQLLKEMEKCKMKPDDVALVAVLNACSHSGLVEEALELLTSMEREWALNLTRDMRPV